MKVKLFALLLALTDRFGSGSGNPGTKLNPEFSPRRDEGMLPSWRGDKGRMLPLRPGGR